MLVKRRYRACFNSLPVTAMPLKSAKPASSVVATSAPFRLLIVEEDDTDALRIEQAFQQEVPLADSHRARTVAEARALLSETAFAATLVSHELPDGDCFDVLDFILESALDLPVVVLTQYGHDELAISAMKAGASDCIRKE
jgi:two-component system response regulator PilR (NtrC family)